MIWSLALVLAAQSAAEELSGRQLRKLEKKADQAYEAGRADEALGHYREILDGTERGAAERQNALYALLMSHLTVDAEGRAAEEVHRLLSEIAEFFPNHPRKLELAAVKTWMQEDELARREAAKNAAELQELQAQFEETQEVAAGEAGEAKSCQEKLSSTARALRGVRSELAKKEEELEKKEEALQKLKDAIVGGGR